ncbi:MAG TPA: divalent-cation tolerance protein CutA [bacterium]|nr:divalent-cation tolerance protein CutA [bacterium]
MESYLIVLTSCASQEEAEKIVQKVLKARLIACANILPGVKSFFWWKGAITSAAECLVVMKTRKKYFKELSEWIQSAHSYKVPEIIAWSIDEGHHEYLDWMHEETELADWQ